MLFLRVCVVYIDVDLKYLRKVIFTVTSKVVEALTQFVTLELTMQLHICALNLGCCP